eukprot:429837_1
MAVQINYVHIAFICFTALCLILMFIFIISFFYKIYCKSKTMDLNGKYKTSSARLQRLISLLCMLSCIICSSCDLFKMIWCYINNEPTTKLELVNAISDIFLYISSMLLYIRLIYFQLHVPFSQSAYAYSSKSLCFTSIPILISLISMGLYVYGMIIYVNNVEKEDDYIAPYLITIMVMDSLLNIIILYLFTKQLKQLILDTPFQEVVQRNVSNSDTLSQIWQETFTGTHVNGTVALIARYSTLTVTAVISNQIYFITMGLWSFVWRESNMVGYITFTARGVSNCMCVMVQYLLFYRYTKRLYHLLCGTFDGVCFRCCLNTIKRKYKTNVSAQIQNDSKR